LPYFLKLGQPDPTKMSRVNFSSIGRLFKFTKKKDDTFIQRIVEVFKADWFYGSVDRNDAQNQLEAFSNKKTDHHNYFIIRFANSKQLCFTYKANNNWENSNIEPDLAFKEGYSKYVSKYQPLKMVVSLKHEAVPSLQKTFLPYKKK